MPRVEGVEANHLLPEELGNVKQSLTGVGVVALIAAGVFVAGTLFVNKTAKGKKWFGPTAAT